MKLPRTQVLIDALCSSTRADIELIGCLIKETLDFDLEEEDEKKEKNDS